MLRKLRLGQENGFLIRKKNVYAEFNNYVHFFCFWPWIFFLGKFGLKIQNCFFKVKFDTKTNLNMQNSMVVSILSVLDWKYLPFSGKFGPKIKIIRLSWKLVLRLIPIWRIQWWCSSFFVFDRKYPFFFWKLAPKIKIFCWSWILEPTISFTIFWNFLMFY